MKLLLREILSKFGILKREKKIINPNLWEKASTGIRGNNIFKSIIRRLKFSEACLHISNSKYFSDLINNYPNFVYEIICICLCFQFIEFKITSSKFEVC